MSTLNNVFKKLEHTEKVAKVNLESQKVELALTDDIKKLMSEAINNKNQYNNAAQKSVDALKEAKRLAINWRDNLSEANKLIINLNQKANELGVEIPKEVLAYKDIISKGVKDADDYVKIISKSQMDIPLN
jgi:formylmethanofuran dehydrogenase subunit B